MSTAWYPPCLYSKTDVRFTCNRHPAPVPGRGLRKTGRRGLHRRQRGAHAVASLDSFGAKSQLSVGDASYEIYRIDQVEGADRLPYSLKILLENLLRTEDGANITADH